MSNVSVRAALFTGGTTIDARLCAEVGAELARVREERGLTVAAVAEQLLLSSRQVLALEIVDVAAFHNATFYMSGLRKYAAFAGLPPQLVERAATSEPLELVPGHADPLVDIDEQPRSGLRSLIVVGVAVALLAAVAYFRPQMAFRTPLRTGSPRAAGVADPAASLARGPVAPIPGSDLPPPEPPPQVDPSAVGDDSRADFGAVRVPRPTWLFLQYADNTAVQRPMAGGETVVFEKRPVFLALGTTDVELTVGGRRVNVAPFVVNGQLRVRAPEFGSLLDGDEVPPDTQDPDSR